MGWTDASKERFKDLWKDQKLSAVNIALILTEEYGEIITRNAVLGMRLRLNLPLRGISAQERARTYTPRPRAPKSTKTRFDRPPDFKPEPLPEPERLMDYIIPDGQRRTLLELGDATCRWPVGDPSSPDFFFCGGEAATGLPYCRFHCHVAYQPASVRRKSAERRAA